MIKLAEIAPFKGGAYWLEGERKELLPVRLCDMAARPGTPIADIEKGFERFFEKLGSYCILGKSTDTTDTGIMIWTIYYVEPSDAPEDAQAKG